MKRAGASLEGSNVQLGVSKITSYQEAIRSLPPEVSKHSYWIRPICRSKLAVCFREFFESPQKVIVLFRLQI